MADDRELLDRAIRQFRGRPDAFDRLVRRRDRRRRTRRVATIAMALIVAAVGIAIGVRALSIVPHHPKPVTTPRPGTLSLVDLRSVQFVDEDTGWALASTGRAGRVLRTVDGGRTWSDVGPRGLVLGPFGGFRGTVGDKLFARDSQQAWVASVVGGQLAVFLTLDGGRSWDRAILPVTTGRTECSVTIAFASLTGLLDTTCGEGRVFVTSLAGRSWQRLATVPFAVPGPISFGPNDNQPNVVAGSNRGSIYQAAVAGGIIPTSGLDWTCIFAVQGPAPQPGCSTVQSPPAGISSREASVSVVPPVSQSAGFGKAPLGALAVTYRQGSRIVDVFSVSRGTPTWRSTGAITGTDRAPIATDAAATVSLVDARHWFAAIGTDLLRTTDAGRHWARIPSVPGGHPIWIQFVSPTQGWLIAGSATGSEALYKTGDGGGHWIPLTP
jgi:photosystem II stability/assembly factor-like uncharacterized protein